jgi:hypothetical protein
MSWYNMTDIGNESGWDYESKGSVGQKVLVAVLLIFPMLVFAITPIYNFTKPEFLGMPFFYWFETIWLVVTTVFYLIAALLLNRMENGGK